MNLIRRLIRRARRKQSEAEMAEEMRFHLEERADDFAADGLAAEEARFAAQRKFGNLGSLQERAREARGWGGVERAWKDVRLGVRQLRKSPGFTLLAVITLGLGIGANTAMFSILNGVLLKPLPFHEVARLDRFYRVSPQTQVGHFALADALEFVRAPSGYGDASIYTVAAASLAAPGQPAEMASGARISPNLLPLLGTPPALGRNFTPGEDVMGADRVVILSHRSWQNRYGGKPDIIGRTIRVDGTPHEVVGVMPEDFNDWRYFGDIDIFRPLAFTGAQATDRVQRTYRIVGRRPADRPAAEAAAFVANFGRRLATEFPAENAGSSWRTLPLQEAAASQGGPDVVVLLIGLSGFVLLIACGNLANLLLARTMARAREFAVRSALGASRTQLLRPLVAESLVLALAGGGIALLSALWFRDWAAARSTGENGAQVYFELDWRVAGWAFGASILTALAFGLAPALFALRLDLNHVLKSGGRGAVGGVRQQRFGRMLIVGQFALAMVVLAGAGLFIRGLHQLNHRRAGWNVDRVITGTILMPPAKYADANQIAAMHRLALERLAALPGVATASLSATSPIFNWLETRRFLAEGQERPQPGLEPAATINAVSHQYFDTFGTRLLRGRTFDDRDQADAPPAFIISQATASAFFGDRDPVGLRLARIDGDELRWGTVVGVAADVASVEADPVASPYQIYLPLAQDPRRQIALAVRTKAPVAAAMIAEIRAAISRLDPDLPVRSLQSAEATIERANYQLAVLRDVLAAIGLLGLGLASLGVYGIIARTMAQRTGEFAIRLALGATVGNLTRIVLTTGVKLALAGSALGLMGAFAVARFFAAAFPGIDTNGIGVLAASAALLVAVGLLACWLPARRAGRVDAMAVLRAE